MNATNSGQPTGTAARDATAVTGVALVQKANRDHRQKQRRLQDRRQVLHAAAYLHAFPLQQREQQNHAGGKRAHVAVRRRNQIARVFTEDDRDGGKAAGRRDPIAPADNESRVIAQRGPREIILPAALRQQRAQFGELQRAQRHVDSARGPRGEVQPGRGQQCRDLARRAHDSGANRVADGHRDPKTDAQRGDQPAAPGRVVRQLELDFVAKENSPPSVSCMSENEKPS